MDGEGCGGARVDGDPPLGAAGMLTLDGDTPKAASSWLMMQRIGQRGWEKGWTRRSRLPAARDLVVQEKIRRDLGGD